MKHSFKYILVFIVSFLFTCSGYTQDFPGSFKGTAVYLDTAELQSKTLLKLDEHIRTLNQQNIDSLKSTIFTALEGHKGKYSKEFEAFIYETLLIYSYQYLGDLSMALDFSNKRIRLLTEIKHQKALIGALTQRIYLLADLDSTESALASSLLIRDMLPEISDPIVKAYVYRQLCGFYHRIKEYETGMTVCSEAAVYIESLDNKARLGDIYETIALISTTQGASIAEIIQMRKKAISYAKLNQNFLTLRVMYRNLAMNYMRTKEVDSTRKYFRLMFSLHDKEHSLFSWITDQATYAEFLIEQGDTKEVKAIVDTLTTTLVADAQPLFFLENRLQ